MADKMVNGRRALLQCLDSVLAEERNIKTFKELFQSQIEDNALAFLKDIIMPLTPKDSLSLVDPDADNSQSVSITFTPATPKRKEET